MIDFGPNNNENTHIGFGNLTYLNGLSALSIVVRFRLKDISGTSGTTAKICGKSDPTGFGGWWFNVQYISGEWRLQFQWFGAGGGSWVTSTSGISDTDLHTAAVVWTGSGGTTYFYLDGVSVGSPSNAVRAMAATSNGFAINNRYEGDTTDNGGSFDMDHLGIYPGITLSADGIKAFHAGMLRIDGAKFWWTGQYAPGRNELKHASGGEEAGTNYNGTPTQTEEAGFPWHWPLVGFTRFACSGEASDPSSTEEGLMAESMFEELTGRARVNFGLEIDLPDGTTARAALESLPTSVALYKNLLKNIDNIKPAASDDNYGLQEMKTTVRWLDKGREFSKRLAGEFEGKIEGSPCRIKLISPHVLVKHWFPVFSGVFERWEADDLTPLLTIHLGVYDKPLEAGAALGVVNTNIFPDCAGYGEGEDIPAHYGSEAALGTLTAIRVSETEFLASAAHIAGIVKVYDGDAEQTSGWSQQNTERAGRYFTEIEFDSAPSGTVTFRANGIEKYGDGSGSPITNPADQFLHALANWYYGKYERGAYYSAEEIGAPINTKHLAATAALMTQYGWTGKTTITKAKTGYQLCSEWANQWRVPLFWGFDGKINVRFNRWYVQRSTQPKLHESDALSTLRTLNPTSKLRDEVVLQLSDGTEIRAKDVLKGHNVDETISNQWFS